MWLSTWITQSGQGRALFFSGGHNQDFTALTEQGLPVVCWMSWARSFCVRWCCCNQTFSLFLLSILFFCVYPFLSELLFYLTNKKSRLILILLIPLLNATLPMLQLSERSAYGWQRCQCSGNLRGTPTGDCHCQSSGHLRREPTGDDRTPFVLEIDGGW